MASQYQTISGDHFPNYFFFGFTDTADDISLLKATQAQTVLYEKVTWRVWDEKKNADVELGLRYGDNPGQEAALFRPINGLLVLAGIELIRPGNGLVGSIDSNALIRSGKHPGRTNLTDIDSALGILRYFSDYAAVAIIKHNNPSGVAISDRVAEAYRKAWEADPVAPFGGVLVTNRPLDRETAEAVTSQYYEVVCAPDFEEGVVEILAARKNLRIVKVPRIATLGDFANQRTLEFKTLTDGSIATQWSYVPVIGKEGHVVRNAEEFGQFVEIPTDIPERLPSDDGRLVRTGRTASIQRKPTKQELEDLWFAWMVEAGVISNSIVAAKDGATLAIGVGGQDRVLMARQVVNKAMESRKALLSYQRFGMNFDALVLEVRRGAQSQEAIESIEADAKVGHAGLEGAVAASDAFFPFRDGTDQLLNAGVAAIAHPGGSLRDFDSIEACNEVDATMVFTHQRAFRH